MDEINTRFKEMRKRLKLSQKQLGDSLGLSDSGISSIEKGTRNVTAKHIKLLEATFGIRENWLRTGEEPMLVQSDASLIDELATEYKMSEKQKKIVATFASMDEKKREVLAEAFFEFIDAFVSSDVPAPAATTHQPAESDEERKQREWLEKVQREREEAHRLLDEELDAKEKAEEMKRLSVYGYGDKNGMAG